MNRHSPLRGFAGLLVGAVLAMACGSDDAAAEDGAKSAFVDRYCQTFVPCCQAESGSTSVERCVSLTKQALEARAFDPAAGDACLASVSAVASASDFCGHVVAVLPRCDAVFLAGNTKQLGESCTPNDCAPSAEGDVDCVNWVGGSACQVRIRGAEGATPCTLSPSSKPPPQKVFDCRIEDGLACDTGVDACVVLPKRFEPCRGDGLCEPTSRCDTGVNRCIERTAEGAACRSDKECDTGLVCHADVCAKTIPTGGACTDGGAPCVPTAFCRAGKCQAIASELGGFCGE